MPSQVYERCRKLRRTCWFIRDVRGHFLGTDRTIVRTQIAGSVLDGAEYSLQVSYIYPW